MKTSSNKFYPRSLSALSKNTPSRQADAFRVRGAGFFSSLNLLSGVKTLTMILLPFIIYALSAPSSLYASEISLPAIAQIESGGCKNPCIGDNGLALGTYQLHQGVVVDYNRHHNTRYLHQDALDSKIAHKIGHWYLNTKIPAYLKYYRLADTLENRLTAWNAGIGNVKKGFIATSYIQKYKGLTNGS